MKLLAIDPGLRTGFALLDGERFTLVCVVHLEEMSSALEDVLCSHKPDRMLCEGWERRGNRLDAASIYPNRVLGMCEMAAKTHGLPMTEVFSSLWMRQFGKNCGLLPNVPRVPAKSQTIAKAITVHLGHYPEELFVPVAADERRHAIDAVGLALWGSLCLYPARKK